MNERITITRPSGQPYMTLRQDNNFVHIQIHDYDHIAGPIEFNFDKKALQPLINGLVELKESNDRL